MVAWAILFGLGASLSSGFLLQGGGNGGAGDEIFPPVLQGGEAFVNGYAITLTPRVEGDESDIGQ